jgi:hypothetical protein
LFEQLGASIERAAGGPVAKSPAAELREHGYELDRAYVHALRDADVLSDPRLGPSAYGKDWLPACTNGNASTSPEEESATGRPDRDPHTGHLLPVPHGHGQDRRSAPAPRGMRGAGMSESVCTRAPAMPCSMILAADRGLCMCGRSWTETSDRSGDDQADLCGDRLA